jgi:hypothetical protein
MNFDRFLLMMCPLNLILNRRLVHHADGGFQLHCRYYVGGGTNPENW